MVKIILLSRYYQNLNFKYSPRSLIKPVNIQRNRFDFLNQLRAYAEKKLGGDPKSKKGETKKPALKMPGFVRPETLNEEVFYSQKSKAQLEQIKRKPESIQAPDKKEK